MSAAGADAGAGAGAASALTFVHGTVQPKSGKLSRVLVGVYWNSAAARYEPARDQSGLVPYKYLGPNQTKIYKSHEQNFTLQSASATTTTVTHIPAAAVTASASASPSKYAGKKRSKGSGFGKAGTRSQQQTADARENAGALIQRFVFLLLFSMYLNPWTALVCQQSLNTACCVLWRSFEPSATVCYTDGDALCPPVLRPFRCY
jgi:hypothetical protein